MYTYIVALYRASHRCVHCIRNLSDSQRSPTACVGRKTQCIRFLYKWASYFLTQIPLVDVYWRHYKHNSYNKTHGEEAMLKTGLSQYYHDWFTCHRVLQFSTSAEQYTYNLCYTPTSRKGAEYILIVFYAYH